jgi:ABC-2 type transport system ATP-binding protein
LETVADRRTSTFSLGMSQRLGIAAALLGDPPVLMFDEPINGLDPEGIVWVRQMMRALAAEGRTVFVSSHLMSEMAITADHLVVIGRGHLIAEASVSDFIDSSSQQSVRVRSPQGDGLAERLRQAGATVRPAPEGEFDVVGMDSAAIGELAAANGFVLHQLATQRASLEEAFMELTRDSVEYHAAEGGHQ